MNVLGEARLSRIYGMSAVVKGSLLSPGIYWEL